MSWFDFRPGDDRDLETEIMRSDRLRAAIVGTAFLVAALAIGIVSTQAWRWAGGEMDFLSKIPYAWAVGGLVLLGAYEFVYRFITGRLMARGHRFPLPPRLFNAALEVSVPTMILAVLTTVLPAETALNLPPLFVYFFFLGLSTLRLDPRLAVFTGVVAGLEYAGLAWLVLPSSATDTGTVWALYLSKGVMLAITGGILGFVTQQLRKRIVGLLRTREQQSKMAAIFGQHVSPSVMRKLLTQEAGQETEVRQVTVLFLDIRNFTTFSESREPAAVVDYLNRLFGFMVDLVNAHQGIINKFLGDGFMAVFGAPLDDGASELNAIRAAVAISDRLKHALAEGLEPTRIGMGLHSGQAVTGNVGSTQRQEYTIIGDVVNLASRIESQTKVLGAEILVSDRVWASARQADPTLAGTPVGPVQVKGRESAVELVQIR